MKFFQAILDFFATLFGGKNKGNEDPDPPETVIPGSDTHGETTAESTSFWEDGGEVPTDSIVTPVSPREWDVLLADGSNKDAENEANAEAGTNEADASDAVTVTTVSVDSPEGTVSRDEGDTLRSPKYMWCLDNGHGESTPGKRSPKFEDDSQFFEYEFTRDINARVMKAMDILGLSYFNVVPEIEGDIPLGERCNRANTLKADLPKIYLSIHANANGNGRDWNAASGVETWFHGRSVKGKNLASAFQKHIINRLDWKDRGIRFHEPPERAFYVLQKTNMAAVLTENGFYTNLAEATKLADNAWREKIAKAHIDAILEIEDKGVLSIDTYPKVQKIAKK